MNIHAFYPFLSNATGALVSKNHLKIYRAPKVCYLCCLFRYPAVKLQLRRIPYAGGHCKVILLPITLFTARKPSSTGYKLFPNLLVR